MAASRLITKSFLTTFLFASLLILPFVWESCAPPEPFFNPPAPGSFEVISGFNQTAPARGMLKNEIVVGFKSTEGLNDEKSGNIFIKYQVIKGNGSVSILNDTIKIPEVLISKVSWTLGDVGPQQMLIEATWENTKKAVLGTPITVNAKTLAPIDFNGNRYNAVQIGKQVWMDKNLQATTSDINLSPFANLTEESDWINTNTTKKAGYCWYQNDISNKEPYGALYNFHAVNTLDLCPFGWHVPSDAEFAELINTVGGDSIAGKKLKEVGLAHWLDKNEGTNEYLFTAVGGGFRTNTPSSPPGAWGNPPGTEALWLTSTEISEDAAVVYMIHYESNAVVRYGSASDIYTNKSYGASVRCIQNQ